MAELAAWNERREDRRLCAHLSEALAWKSVRRQPSPTQRGARVELLIESDRTRRNGDVAGPWIMRAARLKPEARGSADGSGHENYEATHGGTNEKKKQGDAFEIGHGSCRPRLGEVS